MKQSLSMADKKKIITDIITQSGIQSEKAERKTQIMACLQLLNHGQQASCINFLKDRLADWIIANYIQLKANTQLFLQYGNLKFLTKQNRDMIHNIFKMCEEKIGDSIDYNDIFQGILLKNPYLNYQHMGYMYPPYMMPPNYTPDRQNYENYDKMYGMDMQNYYMQMSKYGGYPVNQLFMPPMPMPMTKYGGPQPADTAIKPSYYNYPNPQPPAPVPPIYSAPPQAQKQPKVQAQMAQKPKGNQNSMVIKSNKQHNSYRQIQEKQSNLKKYKGKTAGQYLKNGPFQIIPPHLCKTAREEIPQRIPGIAGNPNESQEMLNQTNGLIENIDLQSPQIVEIPKSNISHQPSKTQGRPKKTILSSYSSQLGSNITNSMKNFTEEERQKKIMQSNQRVYIQTSAIFYEELKNCTCRGYGIYQQKYTCTECGRKYHYHCTSKKQAVQKQQNSQVCHFCFMKNIDPLNKVQIQIKTLYIMDIKHNKITEYIDFQAFDSHISKNSPYEIQVRSMKLQDASNSIPEYTWPDQCLVMLNQQKTIQFQALQHNSSLKKRKDMSIFLTSYIYFYNKNYAQRKNLPIGLEIKQNTILELNQKKIKNNYIFLFGIYLIKKKSPEQLCEEIMKNPSNKVNFAEKFFAQVSEQDEIQIEQIKVNLMDPFSWNLIDIPVRGIKCIHGQCFDLKTFLSFMNVQKVRQWKCPVCNKQCRSFKVDTKQLDVIKQFKKKAETEVGEKKLSRQISFHRNGTTMFQLQKQEQDDKNENSADPGKTKIIQKEDKQSK